jgi:type IV fimbrial biogenesis protein FimT
MKKDNGFSLIELMITLAMLAILLTIGVPGFFELLSNNRMTSTTNSISAGLQAARSEAIIRKVPIKFCQNNGSGTGCAGTMNSLAAGWLIHTDIDNDGTIDAGVDEIIRVVDAFPSNISFTLTGFGTFVRYTSTGIADNTTAPASIRICDSSRSGEQGNDILLNGTGGVSVSATKPTCT